MKRSTALFVMALCFGPSLAFAHGKATGIVRERMDQMVILKDSMKTLKVELSQGEAYDVPTVLNAAQQIEKNGGEALISMFPAGSLTKHSDSLQSVWDKPEEFSALALEMERLAREMAVSVNAGTANVRNEGGVFGWLRDQPTDGILRSPIDLFGALANTCNDCHQGYRSDLKSK